MCVRGGLVVCALLVETTVNKLVVEANVLLSTRATVLQTNKVFMMPYTEAGKVEGSLSVAGPVVRGRPYCHSSAAGTFD